MSHCTIVLVSPLKGPSTVIIVMDAVHMDIIERDICTV